MALQPRRTETSTAPLWKHMNILLFMLEGHTVGTKFDH